jgi:hypothetical protein
LKACWVPSFLAQVIVAGPVLTATAEGLQKKEVPRRIKNIASLLLVFLA